MLKFLELAEPLQLNFLHRSIAAEFSLSYFLQGNIFFSVLKSKYLGSTLHYYLFSPAMLLLVKYAAMSEM